jgi:hypothetical protein
VGGRECLSRQGDKHVYKKKKKDRNERVFKRRDQTTQKIEKIKERRKGE